MKSTPLCTLFSICVLLGLASCEFNNEEELYPCNVETVPVTYNGTIAPIIERNCDDACHGFNGISGIRLKYYEGLKSIANAGRLVGALRHSQGFSPMPKGRAQLPECDILKIEKWIDEGTPYN